MKLLAGTMAFATAACVPSSTAAVTQMANPLTPTKLIATAGVLTGHTATVVGYFTWRTDTRALWEDHAAYLDAQVQSKGEDFDYWAKCVTIYQRDASARNFTDQVVRVTGKVVALGPDALWTCNRIALEDAVISPA